MRRRFDLIWFALAGLVAAGPGSSVARTTADPEIRLDASPSSPFFGTFEVTGLDPGFLAGLAGRELSNEQWKSIFAVYTGSPPSSEGSADKPAVTGSYEVDGDRIRFLPRYPLVAGLAYGARLRIEPAPAITASFALPRAELEPTTYVTRVYPTSDEVPENLLRLYVYFSAPMSRGEAYERVRLFREPSGEPIDHPFVEIAEELWDPELRRLTLLFDPGRIKRGLRPHEEVGPPLVAGGSYRLVVDGGWPDARGVPLTGSYEKRLTAVAADRTSPDPDDWRLEEPPSDSLRPVVLSFPEPLDQALLNRVLRVLDEAGRPVPGRIETRDGERQWAFLPERAWRAGSYEIEARTILEDLVGNNLRNVFDVDLDEPSENRARGETVSLRFDTSAEGSR